jgi:hypothetical protein
MKQKLEKLTLTLDMDVALNGMTPAELKDRLKEIGRRALNDSSLTDGSLATLERYKMTVKTRKPVKKGSVKKDAIRFNPGRQTPPRRVFGDAFE